ncbi:MAG: hypothetical protein WC511_02665 [Candidatus Pacearchaeota archaeon]
MIKKYSQLASIYTFPKERDTSSFEEFREKYKEVKQAQVRLMLKKLLPKGGKVPTADPGTFYIVSKEPTDKTKWRVTRFITHNGEVMPSGHVVCDKMYDYKPKDRGFTESVYQNISPDWDKWAAE